MNAALTPSVLGLAKPVRGASSKAMLEILATIFGCLSWSVLCGSVGLCANPIRPTGKAAQVIDQHCSARDAITSVSCRIKWKNVTLPSLITEYEGQYIRPLERIRVESKSASSLETVVVRDGVVSVLERINSSGRTVYAARRRQQANLQAGKCDLAGLALFQLDVPATQEYVGVEALLAKADEYSYNAERHTLELQFKSSDTRKSEWKVSVRFNPDVNFLIDLVEYRCKLDGGHEIYRRHWVESFVEPIPSVFFPQQVYCDSTTNGKESANRTIELSEIVVNGAIPESAFQLRYPHGIVMTDDIRRSYYQINANGERIGGETATRSDPRLTAGQAGGIGGHQQEDDSSNSQPEVVTLREPVPWTTLILPISLVILVALLTLTLIRQIRSKRAF